MRVKLLFIEDKEERDDRSVSRQLSHLGWMPENDLPSRRSRDICVWYDVTETLCIVVRVFPLPHFLKTY